MESVRDKSFIIRRGPGTFRWGEGGKGGGGGGGVRIFFFAIYCVLCVCVGGGVGNKNLGGGGSYNFLGIRGQNSVFIKKNVSASGRGWAKPLPTPITHTDSVSIPLS